MRWTQRASKMGDDDEKGKGTDDQVGYDELDAASLAERRRQRRSASWGLRGCGSPWTPDGANTDEEETNLHLQLSELAGKGYDEMKGKGKGYDDAMGHDEIKGKGDE